MQLAALFLPLCATHEYFSATLFNVPAISNHIMDVPVHHQRHEYSLGKWAFQFSKPME
jgi:hypothetical protein